jgi:uncharacterized protein (UPF0333 family)
MRKAQGALEYLIIIAAVLAVAAVVVLFLSRASASPLASGGYSACKNQAASCGLRLATAGAGTTGTICQADCMTACTNTKGNDVVSGVAITQANKDTTCKVDGAGTATGCSKCTTGSGTGW